MDPPTKIWYGDLDLTLDLPKLLELSREIGLDVLVLWEWDGRFENEEKPRVDSSVLRVRPDGTHKLGERLTDLIHEETLTRKKG
jgi:endonuclease/exonuclease/phosphatase family metal-dependent hydrolase